MSEEEGCGNRKSDVASLGKKLELHLLVYIINNRCIQSDYQFDRITIHTPSLMYLNEWNYLGIMWSYYVLNSLGYFKKIWYEKCQYHLLRKNNKKKTKVNYANE